MVDCDGKALIDAVISSFGRLDYAFNNAGIEQNPQPLPDQTYSIAGFARPCANEGLLVAAYCHIWAQGALKNALPELRPSLFVTRGCIPVATAPGIPERRCRSSRGFAERSFANRTVEQLHQHGAHRDRDQGACNAGKKPDCFYPFHVGCGAEAALAARSGIATAATGRPANRQLLRVAAFGAWSTPSKLLMAHRLRTGEQTCRTRANSDGRHYDALKAQNDVAFYLAQAQAASGPVLEVGCGAGRVTIPLAAAGIDITGSCSCFHAARSQAQGGKPGPSHRLGCG